MLLLLLFVINLAVSPTKGVMLRHYNMCSTEEYPINWDITFTKTTPQIFNLTLTAKENIGNNIMVNFDWKLRVTPTAPLMKIWDMKTQDGPCKLFTQYMGPLFTDVQKRMGMLPGCPIIKGRYNLVNYKADFGQLAIKNLPKGSVITSNLWTDKKTKKTMYCATFFVDF